MSLIHAQVLSGEAMLRIQRMVETSPAEFWCTAAARELHWFHSSLKAWLSRSDGTTWTGWHAHTGAPVQLDSGWTPWATCDNGSKTPVCWWFHGAQTKYASFKPEASRGYQHRLRPALSANPEYLHFDP